MVINDLYLERMTIAPHEAKAPLIVDPDAPLTFTVSQESFQTVARKTPKVAQFGI